MRAQEPAVAQLSTLTPVQTNTRPALTVGANAHATATATARAMIGRAMADGRRELFARGVCQDEVAGAGWAGRTRLCPVPAAALNQTVTLCSHNLNGPPLSNQACAFCASRPSSMEHLPPRPRLESGARCGDRGRGSACGTPVKLRPRSPESGAVAPNPATGSPCADGASQPAVPLPRVRLFAVPHGRVLLLRGAPATARLSTTHQALSAALQGLAAAMCQRG